ncbi:hypothetical protein SFB4_226G0, partial [Candidatus Arthromitus sp. SFB-4]
SIYDGDVKYMYFRPIPNEKLYSLDSNNKKFYDSFISMDEFKGVLDVLHKNNYMIINIADLYDQVYREGSFRVKRKILNIPKGKIPFVLFVDDFGYSSSRLIIDDEDMQVKMIKVKNGNEEITEDNNVITIINKFVRENEGFSFNNAKGVLSIVDSESIFGYNTGRNISKRSRISTDKIKKLSNDIYEAKRIADNLKNDGWIFACNTYGNIDFKDVTLNLVKNDMDNWYRYVSNIIGYTNLFVYPSGNVIDKNDERFKYLNDSGFNIFCSSMKKMNNKDCFKIQPYVNISRDLICYDITSLHHNEYYDILKDIIINPRKAKKLYKEGIRE